MAVYLTPFAVVALLAVLSQLGAGRYMDRLIYGAAILGLALFGGLRLQLGIDWPAYEAFFDGIDLDVNPITRYWDEGAQFEFGYYLLNYAAKYLGATSYSAVYVISSLFCGYAVYRFTTQIQVNRFYVLAIYMSYSFFLLHFEEVRQAIAIGFFLLGCTHYLKHRKKWTAVLIMLIGPLFQFSAMMYVVLFLSVFAWRRFSRLHYRLRTFIIVVMLIGMAVLSRFNFYDVLAFIAITSRAADKIAIYRETQIPQGTGQLAYAAYLFSLAAYLWRQIKRVQDEQRFILQYAVITLMLVVAFAFVFPGSYVMYSRAYIVGAIFQGYAFAITTSRRSYANLLIICITLLAACLSYSRFIYFYSTDYVPYRSILGKFDLL